MINQINSLNGVYQSSVQSSSANQNGVTTTYHQQQILSNPNLDGLGAIANYNQPVAIKRIAISPTLPTVIQPAGIPAIKGERVLNSKGELKNIVDKNDTTTTVYTMDTFAPNDAIRKIATYDNQTGKLIKLQENFNKIEDGKTPHSDMIDIREFDKNTGELIKFTTYHEHGFDVSEFKTEQDGTKKVYRVGNDGVSFLTERKANEPEIAKTTKFNKKGEIEKVVISNDKDYTSQEIYYRKGVPTKMETSSSQIQGNPPIEKNPFEDKDMQPAQQFILGYNPMEVQGEKTRYSNGNIESITTQTSNGNVIHYFDVLGRLSDIVYENCNNNEKSISFDYENPDVMYSINEIIDKDTKKTTTYRTENNITVMVSNNGTKIDRSTHYKDNILTSYSEYNLDTKEDIYVVYDKQGRIKNFYT